MRNMRDISIRIRSIVSGLDTFLLLVLDIFLGELDKFLTLYVHPRVVLVPIFISNCTLDMLLFAFKKTLLTYSIFSSFSF
jgi:hypothetical protein